MRVIAKYFKEALREYTKEFAICIILAVVMMLVGVLIPIGSRYYIMQVSNDCGINVILVGLLVFCGMYAIKTVINIFLYRAFDLFGGRYMSHLAISLEKTLQEADYADIKVMSEGVLRNILYTDVINVFVTVGHHIPNIVSSLFTIVLLLIYMLFQDMWMSLLILTATIIGIIISVKSKRHIAEAVKETNLMMKKFDAGCSEYISLIPLVQTNNLVGYFQRKTNSAIGAFIEASRKADVPVDLWTGLVGGYHAVFSILLSAILVWPAAGHNVVDMLFFTLIANMILSESQNVSQMILQVVRNIPSCYNVEKVRSLKKADGDKDIGDIEKIEFENVTFSYPDSEQKVLENVSFILKKGDTVCIKGLNGAGKSTFYKLLTGLYRPVTGCVKLDGESLTEVRRESLNKLILYISQDEKCLNGSIKNYLREISGSEISDATIEEWQERLHFNREDESITGNGDSLSGGQRKKLFLMKLLARADSSAVIIADELAAGMDVETVPIMQELLSGYAKKRDKIIFVTDHQNYGNVECNVVMTFNGGNIEICIE